MKKDFSSNAEEELLALIDQINAEQWNKVSDWFGDRWYDFRDLIGTIKIDNYLDRINDYHKIILDKNNVTKEAVRELFTKARNTDSLYAVRFAASKERLAAYNQLVGTIAGLISPEKGSVSVDEINTIFDEALDAFNQKNWILKEVSGDGLEEKELKDVDDKTLQNVLDSVGRTLIQLTPNVKIGDKYEYAVGPDMVIYYEVEATVKGNMDVDLNYVAEEQQLKFDKFGASAKTDGELSIGAKADSDGNAEISISSSNASVDIDMAGKAKYSAKVKIDNDTYEVKLSDSINEIVFEESIETELESGSVKSTIGIKKKKNNYKPLPIPVEVEVPETIRLPDVEWNAEATAIVIVAVGVAALGIILAPYTGGLSLGFCAI